MSKSIFLCFIPLALIAVPMGEKVVHGDASVTRPSSEQVLVSQKSQNAIVEWDSFSLKTGEVAEFKQPNASSSVLNRVTGGNLSEIYGRMEGNGRIFLVNPNGVLVGESGIIDCASFVATSLKIETQSFISDGGALLKNGSGAKVVNRGRIRAFGGPVFLIGPDVENSGEVEATDVYTMVGDEVSVGSWNQPAVMIRPAASSFKSTVSPYALAMNGGEAVDAIHVRKESGRVFLDTEEYVAKASPFLTGPGLLTAASGLYVEESLDALQQLRTVIPGRLWEEEFAILVNGQGFLETSSEMAKHPRAYGAHRSTTGIGSSQYYFAHAAIEGEPIRLDDRYLEFLDGPYWKTPGALYRMYYLQHNYQKVAR